MTHFDEANAMVHLNVAGQKLRVISPTEPLGRDLRLFLAAADVALSLDQPGRLSIRNVLHRNHWRDIQQLTGAKAGLVAIHIDLDAPDHVEGKGHKIVAHISAAACADLGLSQGIPIYALIKSAKIANAFRLSSSDCRPRTEAGYQSEGQRRRTHRTRHLRSSDRLRY